MSESSNEIPLTLAGLKLVQILKDSAGNTLSVRYGKDDGLWVWKRVAELEALLHRAKAVIPAEYEDEIEVRAAINRYFNAQTIASEPHKRVWTGPGELERSGYIDPSPQA